jgi:septum formation protein
MHDVTYILASQSPRRRELLGKLNIPFEVEPAVGEERICGESPQEIVQNLARAKAQEIAEKHRAEQVLVIGADTVVVLDGQILGKPKDRADMEQMIRHLQGRTHEVYTGVALLHVGAGSLSHDPAGSSGQENDDLRSFAECTKVTFYPMSEQEIKDYALHSDGLDKAGGYGIQSDAARYIKGIEGDYNNVVGLPLARLYQELKNF